MEQRKSILVLQGGGSLGAYECGVYKVLAGHLGDLAVVAGTSIGAVNASLIARHFGSPDRGAGFLEQFWTEVLANPSRLPALPGSDSWQRLSAVWTSLLYGNPHLFTPPDLGWPLQPPVWWPAAFYDTRAFRETLERSFGGYGPRVATPRLIVTAVDVEAGSLAAFDSWERRVTAEHVVASGSLPPWFPPTAIDDDGRRRFYWDGGLWSNSPLPDVLRVLRQQPSSSGGTDQAYRAYVIDVFPRRGRVPQTNWGVWRRINEIVYADKADYDARGAEWVNACRAIVRLLEQHRDRLPRAVTAELDAYKKEYRLDRRADLEVIKFEREVYPSDEDEGLSREIDFSPRRVRELIQQGERDARRRLETASQRAGGVGPSGRKPPRQRRPRAAGRTTPERSAPPG